MSPAISLLGCDSFVSTLRERAHRQADRIAYSFVVDGETKEDQRTYAELDRAARRLAVALRTVAEPGDRAVLLYPPGIEFVESFFACLYAGVIAVPLYPPDPRRMDESLRTISGVVRDSRPRVALTVKAIRSRVSASLHRSPSLAALEWIESDTLADSGEDAWRDPRVSPRGTAFLQYTSGSTGNPKGVRLSHGNLIANQRAISRVHDLDSDVVVGGWVPLHHDMGLIGLVLHAMFLGVPSYLMSPLHFVQKPRRWLDLVTRKRITISPGPSFAYDLCVRRIPPEERESFDLSTWKCAVIAAETVRYSVMRSFADFFGCCGFRMESFRPGYGLAEATLMVTGTLPGREPLVRWFSTRSIGEGKAHESEITAPDAAAMVGCGDVSPDDQVVIVDPTNSQPVGPGEVGEIWVSGSGVAQGYWSAPVSAASGFGARATNRDGVYLRTGDLGFLCEGQLFVAGRIKDTIVVRGRQYHPQDIEGVVERTGGPLVPNSGAAFGWLSAEGEERVVVVQEVTPALRFDREALLQQIRAAIGEVFGVSLHAVLLIRPGTLPKTSSGKVKRSASREAFETGKLEIVAGWRASAG